MYKNMKRVTNYTPTLLERTPTEKGESIEEMLRRLTANKEGIPQDVPPIYTPNEEGVIPDYDIRADRMEVAREATDKFSRSNYAKSAEKPVIENNQQEETEV